MKIGLQKDTKLQDKTIFDSEKVEEINNAIRETELHSLQELKEMNPKEISFTLHKARMGQSGKMMKFSFNGITNTFEEINNEEEKTNYYNNDSTFFSYRKKQI